MFENVQSVKACMLRIWAGIYGRAEKEEGKVFLLENSGTWTGLVAKTGKQLL